jgi:hypothetical protein
MHPYLKIDREANDPLLSIVALKTVLLLNMSYMSVKTKQAIILIIKLIPFFRLN